MPHVRALKRSGCAAADGDHASWLVAHRETGEPVGSVSLHKVNAESLTASIGYWAV